MRLPLPFLLYVTALGLFSWAGWTVYQSRDLWGSERLSAASSKGRDDALELIARGKSKGPKSGDWNYSAQGWWPQFKEVNLIGKLPERKPTQAEIAAAKVPDTPAVAMTPLEDSLELVSLVSDSRDGGKGGQAHIIIRYKPDSGVEPPEWWVRENTSPSAAGRAPGDYSAAPNTAVRHGRAPTSRLRRRRRVPGRRCPVVRPGRAGGRAVGAGRGRAGQHRTGAAQCVQGSAVPCHVLLCPAEPCGEVQCGAVRSASML